MCAKSSVQTRGKGSYSGLVTGSWAVLCIAMLLIAGLGGCGTSSQAVKPDTQPSLAGQKATQPSGQAGTANRGGVSEQGIQSKPMAPSSVVVLKDVHFDFDKYTIRSSDADVLKGDSQWFKVNPGKRVRIEGNCDERGTIEYNLALGQKRADATKGYMVNLGVDAKLMETVSYGKEKPLRAGHDEHAWSENRRAHFEQIK